MILDTHGELQVLKTAPEKMHITLGVVSCDDEGKLLDVFGALVEPLQRLFSEYKSHPRVPIAGLNSFSNKCFCGCSNWHDCGRGNVSVIFATLEGGEVVNKLREFNRVALTALRDAGIRTDAKGFEPHITLFKISKWKGRCGCRRTGLGS